MKWIHTKKHKIGTYEINKISFSCFDDERFVLDDGIDAIAYFHKDSDDGKTLWSWRSIVIMEKYYDDWKELWWLEGIMITKKYCDKKEEIEKDDHK